MRTNVLLSMIILILVLFNVFQLVGNYYEWLPHKPTIHQEGGGYVLRQLHFDRNQADRYKVLIEDHKSRIKDLKSELYQKYGALYSLADNDTISSNTKDSLQSIICKLHQAINDEN